VVWPFGRGIGNFREMPENSQSLSWEEKVASLPASPGVYLFRDAEGKVLYVGKAKSLRARVRSYTKEGGDGRYHVQFLQPKIAELEFIVTDTENEALILENNLIKKHRPRYNLRLRDDKTYYHLRLTLSDPFPRLSLTRRPKKGGQDLLVGPFSSSAAVKETIRTLQEIFPLRRCEGIFRRRERACLNSQIGKCLGPCAEMVGAEEYAKMIEQVVRFLKGQSHELVGEMKAAMAAAAAAEEFERAASLRDRIAAIERTLERQKVDLTRPRDRDVIGFARQGDRVALHRLGYRGGVLLISETDSFARVSLPDEEALGSYLGQLYVDRQEAPDEVLAPFMPADAELLIATLGAARGKKMLIRVPVRGEGRQLVALARSNAEETLKREAQRGEDLARAIEELQRRLHLPRLPRWIEGVDISILAGEAAVGSLVKFSDGEADKNGYRRYKIKTVEGVNDYDMMREVLTRRFSRALREGQPLPDLLLLDGGKGQLNVALAVLADLGIKDLPTAGLAKDREIGEALSAELKKKGERVFIPGVKDPVPIKPGTAALFLLQRLRDEAHRFAISYHKLLRGKSVQRSVLEKIPGIGPKKARALLKHFGGIVKLREASIEEISGVEGISATDADAVKKFLAGEIESASGQSSPA
jgi:excinuclease ABC subunit C